MGLGTAYSEPLSFAGTGEEEILLQMPMGSLVKGNFYVSIGLYRFDELGRRIMMDHITRAFKIEVEGAPVWSTDIHGYVKLPTLHRVN